MSMEEHKISGERLVERVKELVEEGNARRIIVKNTEGHTLLEIILRTGVVGAFFLPICVALGSIAALASNYTVVVAKKDGPVTPAGEIGTRP